MSQVHDDYDYAMAPPRKSRVTEIQDIEKVVMFGVSPGILVGMFTSLSFFIYFDRGGQQRVNFF
jgi:hypothetical protein